MKNALALIIGNNEYVLERDRLNNAVNDANDFAAKLMALGFTVNKALNVNEENFERAVTDFGNDLCQYKVGLFYFSGHGLQIDGVNYLTAVDTSFADDISAKHSSYKLDQIIEYMNRAEPEIKILILDACRDNPLPSQYRGNQRIGLAPIYAPKGTLIAFSTSPGERAMDSGAGRNSIYTGALLNHINDAHMPIEEFFKRVRTSVYNLSNGKQTSWEHTSLIGTFYFNFNDLVHSIELPYRNDTVADEQWQSQGTPVDQIIERLKSYTWDTQKSGINRIGGLNLKEVDESARYLLGRNVLQTAMGGEFGAQGIMEKLATWLITFQQGKENHVLNGMLYEVYFDSKGRFRSEQFKSDYIDELLRLQTDVRYAESFKFIRQQLVPFKDFVYYLADSPPPVLAIDVFIEKFDYVDFDDKTYTGYRLKSVKHENIELLYPTRSRPHSQTEVSFEEFKNQLKLKLAVPSQYLRLSTNVDIAEVKYIKIPWQMKLSREAANIVEEDSDF
jgi:hypothetical protein